MISKKKFVHPHDGTWYGARFQYKLEFDFRDIDPSGRNRGIYKFYKDMITDFRKSGWEFRKRHEYTQSFYTNDVELIECVFTNEAYLKYLLGVHYTSQQYATHFSRLHEQMIATDIKFRKVVPEYCYQIYLGGWDWRHNESRLRVGEWLLQALKDDIVSVTGWNRELINRWERSKKNIGQQVLYEGYNFGMKNEDDIMMLHFVAPGHIKKVYKIIQKEKA